MSTNVDEVLAARGSLYGEDGVGLTGQVLQLLSLIHI